MVTGGFLFFRGYGLVEVGILFSLGGGMTLGQVALVVGLVTTFSGLVLFLQRNFPNATESLLWKWVEACFSMVSFASALLVYLHLDDVIPGVTPAGRQTAVFWILLAFGLMCPFIRIGYQEIVRWKAAWREM